MLFGDGSTLDLNGTYAMSYNEICLQYEYIGLGTDCSDAANLLYAFASPDGLVISIIGYRETCLEGGGVLSSPFPCFSTAARTATYPLQIQGPSDPWTLHPFAADLKDFLCGSQDTFTGTFSGTWPYLESLDPACNESPMTYSYDWQITS